MVTKNVFSDKKLPLAPKRVANTEQSAVFHAKAIKTRMKRCFKQVGLHAHLRAFRACFSQRAVRTQRTLRDSSRKKTTTHLWASLSKVELEQRGSLRLDVDTLAVQSEISAKAKWLVRICPPSWGIFPLWLCSRPLPHAFQPQRGHNRYDGRLRSLNRTFPVYTSTFDGCICLNVAGRQTPCQVRLLLQRPRKHILGFIVFPGMLFPVSPLRHL